MRQYEPTPISRPFSPIPPDKVAPVLGATNAHIEKNGFFANLALGVGEGALSTLSGLHGLGQMAESAVGLTPSAGEQELGHKIDAASVAKNPDQQVGKGIEMGLEAGISGLTKTAGSLLEKTGIKGMLKNRASQKATQTAIKSLTPKMTTGEMEEASKSGQVSKTMFGTPKVDFMKNKQFSKAVDVSKGLVKGKSAIEDVNSVRGALSKEATALQKQVAAADHPYTFRELESSLNNVEEPISLRGTPFEEQIGPIKQAALDISKKNGGTVSSLFDSRKEFDALVDKTYPNLYESENAPMRNAITGIRRAMNDFIEQNLPEGSGFRESLEKQKSFYDAIDNIATKVPDEIRKGGALKRTLRNPIAQTIGGGLVGAGTVGTARKLFGE